MLSRIVRTSVLVALGLPAFAQLANRTALVGIVDLDLRSRAGEPREAVYGGVNIIVPEESNRAPI